jgi:hypothetical protein
MDDLPVKITLNQRIYSRVCQKICFRPYTLDETWDLLATLDPHFTSLKREDSEAKEQVKLIHDLCGGNPREITSFVSRFVGMCREHPNINILTIIRSAKVQPSREEQRIREDMGLTDKRKYQKKNSDKSEKPAKKGKRKGAQGDGK